LYHESLTVKLILLYRVSFYLFLDLIVILHSAKTLLNGNVKRMRNVPPSKRTTVTDWSLATVADTRALLFGVTSRA